MTVPPTPLAQWGTPRWRLCSTHPASRSPGLRVQPPIAGSLRICSIGWEVSLLPFAPWAWGSVLGPAVRQGLHMARAGRAGRKVFVSQQAKLVRSSLGDLGRCSVLAVAPAWAWAKGLAAASLALVTALRQQVPLGHPTSQAGLPQRLSHLQLSVWWCSGPVPASRGLGLIVSPCGPWLSLLGPDAPLPGHGLGLSH